MNIYSDAEDIDPVFSLLDKQDFCIPKKGFVDEANKTVEFNPYTLDPQNIGHNQCFTSTVMVILKILNDVNYYSMQSPCKF